MDRLIKKVIETKSHITVGLDTDYTQIDGLLVGKTYDELTTRERITRKLVDYNKGLIDAVAPFVPCVKVQIAFYERYGIPGMIAYSETVDYAKKAGLYVIGDIKRGDIGSTSTAYAFGHLGGTTVDNEAIDDLKVDSITVNPYLGEDAITPFLDTMKQQDGTLFVLVRTSNPLSGLIQNRVTADETVYEHVAKWLQEIGKPYTGSFGYSSVGAVVGATHLEEMIAIRKIMPNAYFLIPGYGAQGGKAEDIAKGFNSDGLGGIVNSSRGIIYAWQKENTKDYQLSAVNAVKAMNQDLNSALKQEGKLKF